MPVGTTGLGVENQVLVFNSLETVKHTCQGVVGLAKESLTDPLPLPHLETLRFGRQHPAWAGERGGTALGVHEIWV